MKLTEIIREFDRFSDEFREVCPVLYITTVANVRMIVKPRNLNLMRIRVPLASGWNVPPFYPGKIIELVPRGGGKALKMEVIVG